MSRKKADEAADARSNADERPEADIITVAFRLRMRRGVPPPAGNRGAIVGEWLSLVEHLVRDQGVGGSNPLSPTNIFNNLNDTSGFTATSL